MLSEYSLCLSKRDYDKSQGVNIFVFILFGIFEFLDLNRDSLLAQTT